MRRLLLPLLLAVGCTSQSEAPLVPVAEQAALPTHDEVAVGPPEQAPPRPTPVVEADNGLPVPVDTLGRPRDRLDIPPPPPPPPPVNDPHRVGGLGVGPWPNAPLVVYDQTQGLLEAPISASTDEAENLWVVTDAALYLMKPGEARFRRYTAADGLHYGPGHTEPPNMMYVVGGKAGEAFVGYHHDSPKSVPEDIRETQSDPYAHTGKVDQVLLKDDGTLEVRFYDFHNTDSIGNWHTRSIKNMVYDHFQHPGNLYVASNHGITRVVPGKWRAPKPGEWYATVEREWFADHVHPWVCAGPCSDPSNPSMFWDWWGLYLANDGRLWMGGETTAGAIGFREDLATWMKSWRPYNPFDPSFGDPYPPRPPVFRPPKEGDTVHIRAIAETPGLVWFASGGIEGWQHPTYGLASWDGKDFSYVNPFDIGAVEYNVLEMNSTDDGRLLIGFPSTGLLVWKPGDAKGIRITTAQGLPSDKIHRVQVDRMVNPPAYLVATEKGLAVIRALP